MRPLSAQDVNVKFSDYMDTYDALFNAPNATGAKDDGLARPPTLGEADIALYQNRDIKTKDGITAKANLLVENTNYGDIHLAKLPKQVRVFSRIGAAYLRIDGKPNDKAYGESYYGWRILTPTDAIGPSGKAIAVYLPLEIRAGQNDGEKGYHVRGTWHYPALPDSKMPQTDLSFKDDQDAREAFANEILKMLPDVWKTYKLYHDIQHISADSPTKNPETYLKALSKIQTISNDKMLSADTRKKMAEAAEVVSQKLLAEPKVQTKIEVPAPNIPEIQKPKSGSITTRFKDGHDVKIDLPVDKNDDNKIATVFKNRDGKEIPYLEWLPKTPPPPGGYPAVIFFTGTEYWNPASSSWLDSAVARGIAVYSPAYRGISPNIWKILQEKEAPESTVSFDAVAEDARDFIEHLESSQKCVDWNHVCFCGGSRGGYVALRLASETGKAKSVVAISPIIAPYDEVLDYQSRKKVEAYFNILDKNRDGAISRDEYEHTFKKDGIFSARSKTERTSVFLEAIKAPDLDDTVGYTDLSLAHLLKKNARVTASELSDFYISHINGKNDSDLDDVRTPEQIENKNKDQIQHTAREDEDNRQAPTGLSYIFGKPYPIFIYAGAKDKLLPPTSFYKLEADVEKNHEQNVSVRIFPEAGHAPLEQKEISDKILEIFKKNSN